MPPPCGSSINDWTLPSLIGTYIDLLLALLFLIGSTLVFLASAFLTLLGLSLPCPCDGLFGCPNCVHARIGSVSRSIRTRFPCENVVFTGYGPDRTHAPAIELPGGSGPVVFGRRPVMGQVRRRRRGRSSGCLSLTGEGVSDNFAAFVVPREEEDETNDVVVSGLRDECVSLVDETAPAIECHSHATEEASSGVRNVYISKGNETTIVHNLERELKDTQAAYSTLCLELEKERSAAATAADEAMAMILRLQSEKAAMEMESSQYRRMIEEKFVYDEEEMEILKEIIVRREKEKHVLEKEVEAYRQMISGEMTGKKHDPSLDCSDDPTMLLKTIYESIRKKEKLDGKMRCGDDGEEGIHQLEFPDPRDEFNLEVQEKGMLTMEIYPSCGQCKSSSIGDDDVRFDSNKFQERGFCKDNSCSNDPSSIPGEDAEKESKIEVAIPVEKLDEEDGQDGETRDINPSYFETDSNVLDVHVIDDGQNLADARIGKASGASQTGNLFELFGKGCVTDESSNTSEFVTSIEIPVASPVGVGGDIRRCCSDMPKGGQLLDSPSDRVPFDLRRSSTSAVDNQRFTLATEVEILRKRLKTIQQGREKLSIPLEHQEKESFQLELLEEIACQLQEIRKITDPGKGIRHASLPPLSSKATSKKRRCRSVSSDLT